MSRQYCHIGSRTIAYLDSAPGDASMRALVLLHAFAIEPVERGGRPIDPSDRSQVVDVEQEPRALPAAEPADPLDDIAERAAVEIVAVQVSDASKAYSKWLTEYLNGA